MCGSLALRTLGVAAAVALVSPLVAPQLLAFPYHARSNGSAVWSETPLPQAMIDRVMARSGGLVAQSPLALRNEPRHVFLTQGGWRWIWLALQSRGTFGLSRRVFETVVINRSDLARDRVWNGRELGGERSLSGVLAHEACHGMERRRFGLAVDLTKPVWLREGYCDHVAQESSLSDADAVRLKAAGQTHPALAYYDGRKRVEAILSANGGDVFALFADN